MPHWFSSLVSTLRTVFLQGALSSQHQAVLDWSAAWTTSALGFQEATHAPCTVARTVGWCILRVSVSSVSSAECLRALCLSSQWTVELLSSSFKKKVEQRFSNKKLAKKPILESCFMQKSLSQQHCVLHIELSKEGPAGWARWLMLETTSFCNFFYLPLLNCEITWFCK